MKTLTKTTSKATKATTRPLKPIPDNCVLVEVYHDTKSLLDRAAEDQGVSTALFLAAAVAYVTSEIERGTLDIRQPLDPATGKEFPDVASIVNQLEITVERKTTMEDIADLFIAGAPNGDFQSIEDSIFDAIRRGQAAEKLYRMFQSLDN
jgi:hypothetical protein